MKMACNFVASFFCLFFIALLPLASFAKIIPQPGSKQADKITALPGLPQTLAQLSQYAGSVVVNNKVGSSLFYYLIESSTLSVKKPLVLWLNGGPLVSSLMGLIEIGPYRVASDGKTLYENIYSWNKAANLLFLETPVGVGFSYCNKTSEMQQNNDAKTADMSYTFLVNWLERFPEYKNRDFYIAGESYAGHYIPQLAQTIVKRAMPGSVINLKGLLIGNPMIDPESEQYAREEFFGMHSMISPDLYNEIRVKCIANPQPSSDDCGFLANERAGMERGFAFSFSNVLANICNSTSNITALPKPFSIDKLDPCRLRYLKFYFNRPEVRQAIHAPSYTGAWVIGSVTADYDDTPISLLETIKGLLARNIRVIIYSGDLDAKIPTAATFRAVQKMNVKQTRAWGPWIVTQEDAYQTGGYTVEYEQGLTFATVRGAGHEVPEYQPERAFIMFTYFLEGKSLPSLQRLQ